MTDSVEALEALHGSNNEEVHFRFMGTAKNRQFIVNVQFACADNQTNEQLQPEEYDFMIGKVLGLILQRLAETPNPALH